MNGTSGLQFLSTAAHTLMSMWSLWSCVESTASTDVMANGSNTAGTARRFGWSFLPPDMRAIWCCGSIRFFFLVRLPVPHQTSTQIFVAFSVLIHTPVQPSHHIANVPFSTCSSSISSLSQVPHSGKVLKIQDSLVTSSTLPIDNSSIPSFFIGAATYQPHTLPSRELSRLVSSASYRSRRASFAFL